MPEATRGPELHGDAATVVLLRESPHGPEVLLLERPSHRGSFAGAWVFPGGYVDPADRQDRGLHDDDGRDPLLAAARRAGVRETREETGMDLDAAGLVPFSIWTPPPSAPKRLRTWFFLAALDGAADAPIILSPDEHVDHAWMTPTEALRRHGEGLVNLVPPTWMTLRWLAGQATATEAVAAARRQPPAEFRSLRTVDGEGRPIVAWAGDEAYDLDGQAGPVGARNRLHLGSLPWIRERTTHAS